MSILKELDQEIICHPSKEVFKNIPKAKVARKLGISNSHLTNVLNGTSKASLDLDLKIKTLARLVEAELNNT